MENNSPQNEELDIKFLLNTIIRNKKFISFFSLFSMITFFLYGFVRKQKWEGQFEIVLSQDSMNNSSPLSKLNLSANLPASITSKSGNFTNNLKTQVGILKSPSTLMPVFDFVNAESNKNRKKTKDLVFKKWRQKRLNFDLKKQTSILQITYTDSNRDLIIPVLNKISAKYQDYSSKDRRRNIELKKDYLNKQINIFKGKSSKSLKDAQEFAIDQDLELLDGTFNSPANTLDPALDPALNLSSFKSNTSSLVKNIAIEQVRVEAANKIKNIDIQIKKINNLGDDTNYLQYLAVSMPGEQNNGILQEIESIEMRLSYARSKFRPGDLSIKNLEFRKKNLSNVLKNKYIGYLNAEKFSAEALMETAMRPKEVLLKYKELLREALRDEQTLVSLENELRVNNLDESRFQDPWELITKPTLDKDPVGLTKSKLGFIGLLTGIFISSLIVIIREKRSGLIFDEEYLESILESKILKRLSLNDNQFEENINEINLEEIFKSNEINKFIFSSNINSKKVSNFKDKIKGMKGLNIDDKSFSDQENLNLIKGDFDLFLITSMENLNYEEISSFKDRIGFLTRKIKGIILI